MKAIFKSPIEGLHYKFLKMALGVRKYTSNWAVMSETGRAPLTLRIFQNMIKFYFHMITSPSELLTSSLATNIRLAKEGHNTWFGSLKRVLKFLNIDHIMFTSDVKEIYYQISILKKTLFRSFPFLLDLQYIIHLTNLVEIVVHHRISTVHGFVCK